LFERIILGNLGNGTGNGEKTKRRKHKYKPIINPEGRYRKTRHRTQKEIQGGNVYQ
jgi:hypothetical protein